MNIAIDNEDGRGLVDFTALLAGEQPVKVERNLNEPSVCTALLSLAGEQVGEIRRNARVVLQADDGTLLFTGYAVNEPTLVFSGMATEGPAYLTEMTAISDEIVLDRQAVPVTAMSGAEQAGTALKLLTQRVDSSRISMADGSSSAMISSFAPDAARSWSENASTLATMARAAYRVVNGQVSLTSIGTTVHALSEANGSMDVAALSAKRAKMLVNDVTVCGAEEPQAYVTEIFQGDGTTAAFTLSERPFAVRGAKAQLLRDTFQGAAVNPQLWAVNDPGARVSITAAGLNVSGGSVADGQTTVAALDGVELGGVLLLEVTGVQLTGVGTGFIGCLYSGAVEQENLFAGFHVEQSADGSMVTPLVMGTGVGGTAALSPGRQYTFRIRTHCREVQRVLASYYTEDDQGSQTFGGGLVAGEVDLVFEVQDTTEASLQKPVVLYDGSAASAPAICTMVALNSAGLACSIRSLALTQEPAVWVTAVQPGEGAAGTQRLGMATEGAQANLISTERLTFYPGSVPSSGALVYVTYRTGGRSVARLANESSIAAETSTAIPGTSRLVCSVTVPPARSTADCENAASALLDVASSRAAAWEGSYVAADLHRSGDVWPGDVLAVDAASAGLQEKLVVRKVEITGTSAAPELLQYKVSFANEWAELLSMQVSKNIPESVWLPQGAAAPQTALPILNQFRVTAVSASQIDISAGQNAPSGGGFEVRRSDWKFGPGMDGDVVLRSPVPNFSIPREAPIEQYFIRMYDGASPPNYSRFSNAVFANVLM